MYYQDYFNETCWVIKYVDGDGKSNVTDNIRDIAGFLGQLMILSNLLIKCINPLIPLIHCFRPHDSCLEQDL